MKIEIEEDLCKSCQYCIEICPKNILIISNKTNKRGYTLPQVKDQDRDSCIGCKKCELICPEMAITIKKEQEEEGDNI